MIKVGLTGNLMSGIDEISQYYVSSGIPVFEADLIFRFFLYNNSDTIIKIRKEFGNSAFTDNRLDINKFNSDEFSRLIKTIEVDLIKAYETWRLQYVDYTFTIFKSRILYEAKWDYLMNYTISVFRPNGLRIQSIRDFYGIRSVEAHEMIDHEMDSLQKNSLANYVIHNYDTAENIDEQINAINKILYSKRSRLIL